VDRRLLRGDRRTFNLRPIYIFRYVGISAARRKQLIGAD
jgi:hypothetical protein